MRQSATVSTAWQQPAAEGRKIEAIKIYREETGCSLKEAKDAVEAWQRAEGITASGPKSGQGCATSLLLIAVLIGLLGVVI